MNRRILTATLVSLSLLSCGHEQEGPTPQQGEPKPAVDPSAVCIEQLSTPVQLSGLGLSPMPINVLEDDPQLALPGVALLLSQDLEGAPASAEPLLIPDDPAAPEGSQLRWLSQQEMVFTVSPELALPEGLYTVQVQNPNGNQGQWPEALLAVPRPRAEVVAPDILCAEQDSRFTISGSGFIKAGAALPRVTATPKDGGDAIELTPSALEQCSPLPGPAGLERCEDVIVELSAGTLVSGEIFRNYDLVVTNPDPVGCVSTEPLVLTMVPAPQLDRIEPELICTAQGDNSVTISGQGFLTIDGVAPTLFLDSSSFVTTASDCTPVSGPAAPVQSCTTLTVTIAQGELSDAIYDASVQNPSPADCVTSQSVSFAVVPPPRVLSLEPDLICNEQADVTLTIQGTGFLSITDPLGSSLPTVAIGDQEFVPTLSGCTTLQGLVAQVETCTELTVTVPMGTLAAGSYDVVVTNPAPGDCYSEEAVILTVVPPPEVSSASPDIVCPTGEGQEVVLSGSGFLTVDGVGPTASIGEASLTAVASDCAPLEGPAADVQTCSTLSVTVPAGLEAGLQQLIVVNPSPAGCASAGTSIYVAAPPVLTALAPPDVCSDLASTTLVLSGEGFLIIDGSAPQLTVDGQPYEVTADGCTSVDGLSQSLSVCTSLSFAVLQGELGAGQHVVALTNPAPADCPAGNTLSFQVVPPPAISGVSPTRLCIGGGTLLISGSGFRPGATVTLDGAPADTVVVVSDQQIQATFGSANLVEGGPYDLAVQNPDGCSDLRAAAVTVILGPQLFFADPPVVYNGITTQVTLYGSGFTGNVGFIGIRPAGSTDDPIALAFTYDALRPNRVQAVVPAGTDPLLYDVLLQDQTTCDAILPEGLRVVEEITLELTAIDPPFGHTGSSTGVTVLANDQVAGGFQPVPRLYLNPTASSQAAGLEAVTYLDPGRVTSVVPAGLPVDTYDLIAVNPDGSVGLLPDAFQINELPPPVLSNITPGSIPNQSGQEVKVTGESFRSPAALLRCRDVTTGALSELSPTVQNASDVEANLIVDASSLQNGAVCVVRIINGDDGSYGELSALSVTNPAQNLTPFTAGPALQSGRRALAAAANRVTSAARYLYAMGGDSGALSGALATVEVAPVDIFGFPGSFFIQQNQLTAPRSFAGAAPLGRCLYLVGGANDGGVLGSVERACLLDPEDSPEIVDLGLRVVQSGGLGQGQWYYQVAAVMPASDPLNPGGETLPSEPFPLLLPEISGRLVEVSVFWSEVPGATAYRVYRSPAPGAAANALELLAEVGASTFEYADGGGQTQAEAPLRQGATGSWQVVASLSVPRQGAGVAVAPDPGDTSGTQFYLYAVGGRDAAGVLDSIEVLPLLINADGSQSVGAVSLSAATLDRARWQLAAYSVGNAQASVLTPPTHYLYAAGGLPGGGAIVSDVDAFLVQAGGELAAPLAVDSMTPPRAGYGAAAANNFLHAFGGGQAAPDNTVTSAKICAASGFGCLGGPPQLENWNNAGVTLTEGRYLMGTAIQSGFIYVLGGQTSSASASSTTEYTIW